VSVCPVAVDPKSIMERPGKLKILVGSPTPFTGRKVKGQGNKVTSQNSFSFAAMPTTGGAT